MQVLVTADEIWPCVQITLTIFQQGLIHQCACLKTNTLEHANNIDEISNSKWQWRITYIRMVMTKNILDKTLGTCQLTSFWTDFFFCVYFLRFGRGEGGFWKFCYVSLPSGGHFCKTSKQGLISIGNITDRNNCTHYMHEKNSRIHLDRPQNKCTNCKGAKLTQMLDKLLEYKRSWIQHLNRMPRNRLPRVMKHYCPTGRRNYGRGLKKLLDTWDRNGSTSGPTPWNVW